MYLIVRRLRYRKKDHYNHMSNHLWFEPFSVPILLVKLSLLLKLLLMKLLLMKLLLNFCYVLVSIRSQLHTHVVLAHQRSFYPAICPLLSIFILQRLFLSLPRFPNLWHHKPLLMICYQHLSCPLRMYQLLRRSQEGYVCTVVCRKDSHYDVLIAVAIVLTI